MAGLLVAVSEGIVLQAVTDPDGPGVAAMTGQLTHLLLASRNPGYD
jgi:hypothetical protein